MPSQTLLSKAEDAYLAHKFSSGHVILNDQWITNIMMNNEYHVIEESKFKLYSVKTYEAEEGTVYYTVVILKFSNHPVSVKMFTHAPEARRHHASVVDLIESQGLMGWVNNL